MKTCAGFILMLFLAGTGFRLKWGTVLAGGLAAGSAAPAALEVRVLEAEPRQRLQAATVVADAEGDEPMISRVIRDEERGTNVDFRLEPERLPEIAVAAPNTTNRVTVGAVFLPATASPGDPVTVLVKVRIAPGHWIYALENSGSGNLPTGLSTPAHSAPFRPQGSWHGPEAKAKDDGSRVYSGEVLFRHRFIVEPGAAATTQKLPITIQYQVCNEALCWPPAKISLEPVLKVVPSR